MHFVFLVFFYIRNRLPGMPHYIVKKLHSERSSQAGLLLCDNVIITTITITSITTTMKTTTTTTSSSLPSLSFLFFFFVLFF